MERRFHGVKITDELVKQLLRARVSSEAVMTGCRWDPCDNTIECFFWDPKYQYEAPEGAHIPIDLNATWNVDALDEPT